MKNLMVNFNKKVSVVSKKQIKKLITKSYIFF